MERCERSENARGVSWHARFSFVDERGKRRFRRVAGKTKEECRKKLAAGKQAPRQTASKESVGAFLERWLGYRKPAWRGSTYASHEMMIRIYLGPAFGDVPLAKLRADAIAAAESAWLEAGKAPATVRMAHATLRTALNQAVAWKLVERNEAALVKPPREPGDTARALTAAERARVLAVADKTPLAAFWHVAAACGLRRGEAMGLQWRDLDFERGAVSIQRQVTRHGDAWVVSEPKTKKSRRLIVLPEPVVAALRKHRARQNAERLKAGDLWQEGDWVFADALGRRVTIGAITYAHQQLEKAADVGHFRLHDLRHTGATLAMAAGVHPKIVQEMLGHGSITMTLDRYSHVAESMQREAAAAIAAALERAKKEGKEASA